MEGASASHSALTSELSSVLKISSSKILKEFPFLPQSQKYVAREWGAFFAIEAIITGRGRAASDILRHGVIGAWSKMRRKR